MEPGLAVTEARPMSELPWEFPAKMRPSLQIWLGLGLTKTFAAAGIHNRFTQMTLIRILVALLSFLLIFRLTEYLIRHLASERARVVALASVGLLWFMPYLHSRFSSEHLTAMAFVAGLLFLFKAEAAQRPPIFWAAAGFCFAASFWLRFQTAFALLPPRLIPRICPARLAIPFWFRRTYLYRENSTACAAAARRAHAFGNRARRRPRILWPNRCHSLALFQRKPAAGQGRNLRRLTMAELPALFF